MAKTRVLIFGGSSNLGIQLAKWLQQYDCNVYAYSRSQPKLIDYIEKVIISDYEQSSISKIISQVQPHIIINCVADISIERCEINFRDSLFPNMTLVHRLFNIENFSNGHQPLCVHISTDHVYARKGYSNEDNISIINNYALSKYLGEQSCISVGGLVLRTNFIARGFQKPSYLDWIKQTLTTPDDQIRLFKDVQFNPTTPANIAKNIFFAYKQNISGTYNLGCSGSFTKADFHLSIAHLHGVELNYELINYPTTTVQRPLDMRMCLQKSELSGFSILDQTEVLSFAMEEYEHGTI